MSRNIDREFLERWRPDRALSCCRTLAPWCLAALALVASCGDDGGASDETANTTGSRVTGQSSVAESLASTEQGPLVVWQPGAEYDADSVMDGIVSVGPECVTVAHGGTDDVSHVVWPIGTTWDGATKSVRLPNGVVVSDGDWALIGGGQVPFRFAPENDMTAEFLGDRGIATLEACVSKSGNEKVALLDATGKVALRSESGA